MRVLKRLLRREKEHLHPRQSGSPTAHQTKPVRGGAYEGSTVESLSTDVEPSKAPPIDLTTIVCEPESNLLSSNDDQPHTSTRGRSESPDLFTIRQRKDGLHSRSGSDSVTSLRAQPRLERSLQHLNISIEEFERIYTKYRGVGKKASILDDSLSKVLSDISLADHLFDNAATLETKISETIIGREELKQERIRWHSLSKYLISIFPLVKFLVDFGGLAAQTAGCVPAGLVLRASAVVVDALSTATNCPEDMASNLKSISYQARRLISLQPSNRTDTVVEKSMDLLTAIVRYYSACLIVFSHGIIAKELFGAASKEYRGVASALQTAITEFDQALEDQNRAVVMEISNFCRGKRDQELFEWLSPSHWEVVGQFSGHIDRYLGGTLTWLKSMPELNFWLAGNGEHILWMTGLPGVGKSIMAAHIISTLHPAVVADQTCNENGQQPAAISLKPSRVRPQFYLAFFFCSNGEDKLKHAHNIVQTISYQLGQQSEIFRRNLNNTRVSEQFTVSPSVGIRLLYSRLIQRPLSALAETLPDNSNVFCVIDGLDEADFGIRDSRSGKSEIAILLHLFAASSDIRLLVLSRRIKEISDVFETIPSVTREISSADNGDDIEFYVEWKISNSKKLRQGFNDLGINPVDHFRDAATCNFLWTDIVLHFLEGSISKDDFESGLYGSPVQFYELYRQILRRIESTAAPRTKRFIKEVIGAVIASPRPLEISELQALIEESLIDRFYEFSHLLKTECGTFLSLVNDANSQQTFVQVAHKTFRDFITSNASIDEEFHVSLAEKHGEIAGILLRYLSQHDFGPKLTTGTFTRWSNDVATQVRQKFPLLRYASTEWSYHVTRSSNEATEKLSLVMRNFFSYGPLLLWVEALAIFNQLPALPKTRDDVLGWVSVQTELNTPPSKIDLDLFKNWARDIARICTESYNVVSEFPNSVYSILFDLFPSPSLFQERYKRGIALVSGRQTAPLDPALTGISSFYEAGYDSSAFSHGSQKLFALANMNHIRVLRQTFGGSVFIIPALGTDNGPAREMLSADSSTLSITVSPQVPRDNRWAVLTMAFSSVKAGQRNMLAAIYVPFVDENEIPYSPKLSIWDIDELVLLANVPLNPREFGDKICLVDWVKFSDDNAFVYFAAWRYDMSKNELTTHINYDMEAVFGTASTVILSPDRRNVLRLDSCNNRVLFSTGGVIISFTKPSYCAGTTNLASREVGYNRLNVPLTWWHLWREVTRAYRFSPDSRWFARFTEQYALVLCDLQNYSERVIYQPEKSLSRIILNDLMFDAKSKRLAWTLNYIDANKSHNTSVHMWSVETQSTLGCLRLGRYGYRDRIDFCSDPNLLLTYRTGIAMWDMSLAMNLDEIYSQSESEGWIIGDFPITQYCIRLGYSSANSVYLVFPESLPSQAYVLQAFSHESGIGRTLTFNSNLLRHCSNHLAFPLETNKTILAVADTIIDINLETMGVLKSMQLASAETVHVTTFDLDCSLMACLQRAGSSSALRLYSTNEGKELACAEITHEFSRALIVFNPTVSSTHVVVLMTEPDQPSHLGSGTSTKIRVSVFDLPFLSLKKTFCINYPALTLDADLSGYISPVLKKLIFYGQRKESSCYMLSIIDMENEIGTSQLLPNIRNLAYIKSKEVIICITADGWVQCKGLEDMELDIIKHGVGQTKFCGFADATWVSEGWKKLIHIPPSFIPCYESGIAVHEKGELTYVGDFGKRLVQISFEW